MKKYCFILACALALAACSKPNPGSDTPGNTTPETSGTTVNINASLPKDMTWSEGDAIGVISSCSRGDNAGVSMSVNTPARLLASKAENQSSFKAATDSDKLLSEEGDRSFKFYAAYPFPEGAENFKALVVKAAEEQTYSENPLANMTFVGSATVLNVLAPVAISMETPFALLRLQMPKDIIPGEKSSLKSITLSGAEDTKLSLTGTYNVERKEFTETESAASVTVNFPNGLVLEDKYTPVYVAVAPFTVPEGGLKLVVETQTASTTIDEIWSGDAGKEIKAGAVEEWTNEVRPVTFPVVFPLGVKTFNEDEGPIGVFSAIDGVLKYQPKWMTDHRWIAYDGPTPTDAYAQWHDMTADFKLTATGFETLYNPVNSAAAYSSPNIRGIWTGDYMEFVIPVAGFKAGTTLNLHFPTYGRQHPMFWDIQYLDGGEWKCNRSLLKSDLPYKDERVTPVAVSGDDERLECEATFVSNRGGNIHDIDITFANAIDEGYVKFRMVSVHAEYQNGGGGDTTYDYIRSAPHTTTTGFDAPFYFYCANDYFGETPDIDESKLDFVISIKQ